MVALFEAGSDRLPGPEVAVHGPARPGGAKLYVKPSPDIDDLDPTVDVLNSLQYLCGDLRDNQSFDTVHDSQSTL